MFIMFCVNLNFRFVYKTKNKLCEETGGKIMKKTIILVSTITIFILIFSVAVIGEDVLQEITVNYGMINKIFVDKQEKVPDDDMKPFVYNGRTYVPLRFVGEALGKPVDWDENTGTVYIGDKPDDIANKEFVDDFSNNLWDNWDEEKSIGSWIINDKKLTREGHLATYSGDLLVLKSDKYKNKPAKFTLEVDLLAAKQGESYSAGGLGMFIGAKIYKGYDRNVAYNKISFYADDNVTDDSLFSYDLFKNYKIRFDTNYRVKVVVNNGVADIYVDNKLIETRNLTSYSDEDNYIGIYSQIGNNFFRNFKFTINE